MDGEKGDQEDACLRLCGSLGSIVRLTWPLNFPPQGSLGGSTNPAPPQAGQGRAKPREISIWHMLLTIFQYIPIPWPLRVSSLRLLETQLALEKLHLVFHDEPFPSHHPGQKNEAACCLTVTAHQPIRYHPGRATLTTGELH